MDMAHLSGVRETKCVAYCKGGTLKCDVYGIWSVLLGMHVTLLQCNTRGKKHNST